MISRPVRAFAFALLFGVLGCGAPWTQDPHSAETRDGIAAVATDIGISMDDAVRRHDLQEVTQPAISAIMADQTNFGGVIYDASGGWYRLHIFYVGENAGGARVAALLPPGTPVEWTRVERSYAELRAIEDELVQLHNDTVAAGGEPIFSSTGIGISRNGVKAALAAPDAALEAELRERFGDVVYVVIEPFAEPLCPPPCGRTD